MERTYIAIDLKSFYASVECVERRLDPLRTNLVVADMSRTEKTICLAVSPSLKAYGISGRARLFEVIEAVRDINRERKYAAVKKGLLQRNSEGRYQFSSSSFNAESLASDASLSLSYITAPPRMRLYEEYSTRVYSIYLKYIAPEDIHVYSIDEVFIDATGYLATYGMSAHELAMAMIREVLYTTGITATAGIGTNLYLAKVAMDIVAKHIPADKDGVRVAQLDEMSYRRLLWCHRPLTDFWRIGRGYSSKLASMGFFTMGDIARASLSTAQERILYKAFGINAELLIDHAWGWEPVKISDIKAYRPQTNSISSGQVLKEPYSFEKACIIVKEMSELIAHDLIRRNSVTKQLVLTVSYDRESLVPVKQGGTHYITAKTGKPYEGVVIPDRYGRPHPGHAHGTVNLEVYTNSAKRIVTAAAELYNEIVDPDLLIRRINIAACALIPEKDIPSDSPEQLSFFEDITELDRKRHEQKLSDEKERSVLRAVLGLQDKFGKNAVIRGLDLGDGATKIERNGQVGGHKA